MSENSFNACAEPARRAPIAEAATRLANSRTTLGEAIFVLAGALAPVMGPKNPESEADPKKSLEGMSELAVCIHGECNLIDELTNMVVDLTRRLEV